MRFIRKTGRFPAGLLLALAVILPCALRADTVFLRNGTSIEGTIINQTRTDVTVQTEQGRRVILKTEVQRIVFGPGAEDQRKAEEQRRIQEQLQQEEQRRIAEQKRLEEQRIQDEKRRIEDQRKAEEQKKIDEVRSLEEEKRKAQEQADAVKTGDERRNYEDRMRRRFLDIAVGYGRGRFSTAVTEQLAVTHNAYLTKGGMDPLSGGVVKLNDSQMAFHSTNFNLRYTRNRWFFGADHFRLISRPVYTTIEAGTDSGPFALTHNRYTADPMKRIDAQVYAGYTFYRSDRTDLAVIAGYRVLFQKVNFQTESFGGILFLGGPLLTTASVQYLIDQMKSQARGLRPGFEYVFRPNERWEIKTNLLLSSLKGAYELQDARDLILVTGGYRADIIKIQGLLSYKSAALNVKFRYSLGRGWAVALTLFGESARFKLLDAQVQSIDSFNNTTGTPYQTQAPVSLLGVTVLSNNVTVIPRLHKKDDIKGISIGIEKRFDFLN